MKLRTYIRTFPERIRYVWNCAYSAWMRFTWLAAGRNPDESPF